PRLLEPQHPAGHPRTVAHQPDLGARHLRPPDGDFFDAIAEVTAADQDLQVEQVTRLAARAEQTPARLPPEHLEAALGIPDRQPEQPPDGVGEQPAANPANPDPGG